MLDIKNLNEEYSIYDYQKDGRKIVDNLLLENKIPIIVGGSGLYLSALLYNYKFSKKNNIYDFDSLSDEEMYNALMKKDSSLVIDKKNRRRLIRAYAKYINNSEPIDNTDGNSLMYDVIFIGLTTDRDTLYTRISNRTDKMIEDDLIKEVRGLYSKYPNSKQLHATICYKEIIDYINNKIPLEEAIIKIKQNCRNYAKRQYTWFNHKMNIKWFDVNFSNFDDTVNEILNYIK